MSKNSDSKYLKPFDWAIIIVSILIFIAIVCAFVFKKKFTNTPNETAKIEFQVMMRGVSITNNINPFFKGEETFITIRNVPYTKLKIKEVFADTKKTILLSPNTKQKLVIVDDPTFPAMYDILVTLEDVAKMTQDGAVVGGNKLKIGVPVVLEGFDYKISGVISSVKFVQNKQEDIKNVNTK